MVYFLRLRERCLRSGALFSEDEKCCDGKQEGVRSEAGAWAWRCNEDRGSRQDSPYAFNDMNSYDCVYHMAGTRGELYQINKYTVYHNPKNYEIHMSSRLPGIDLVGI